MADVPEALRRAVGFGYAVWLGHVRSPSMDTPAGGRHASVDRAVFAPFLFLKFLEGEGYAVLWAAGSEV
jgi:hypothetical protein